MADITQSDLVLEIQEHEELAKLLLRGNRRAALQQLAAVRQLLSIVNRLRRDAQCEVCRRLDELEEQLHQRDANRDGDRD